MTQQERLDFNAHIRHFMQAGYQWASAVLMAREAMGWSFVPNGWRVSK